MNMLQDFVADDDLLSVFFKSDEWWAKIDRPWKLLERTEEKLKEIRRRVSHKAEIETGATVRGNVWIDEGSVISSGAYICGPSIIGKNCTIGPNSVIRPSSILADGAVLYPGTEVKNSVLGAATMIGHFSYVGDSVVGKNCIIGGSVFTAVVRFDLRAVRCKGREETVDTGRVKLGAFIGNWCKLGVGVLIMPGRRIGPHCHVGPGVIVYDDVKENTLVLKKQQLVQRHLSKQICHNERGKKSKFLQESLRASLRPKRGSHS